MSLLRDWLRSITNNWLTREQTAVGVGDEAMGAGDQTFFYKEGILQIP